MIYIASNRAVFPEQCRNASKFLAMLCQKITSEVDVDLQYRGHRLANAIKYEMLANIHLYCEFICNIKNLEFKHENERISFSKVQLQFLFAIINSDTALCSLLKRWMKFNKGSQEIRLVILRYMNILAPMSSPSSTPLPPTVPPRRLLI